MSAISVRFVGLRNGGEFKCFTMMMLVVKCVQAGWASSSSCSQKPWVIRGVSFKNYTLHRDMDILNSSNNLSNVTIIVLLFYVPV